MDPVATSPGSDPRNWRLSVSKAHLALYSELSKEPRDLTPSEARMMVELVAAWRAHEHRKHIALMAALDSAYYG